MQEIIKVKCGKCGKSFQAYKPTSNTANIVDCPYCGNNITIMLNPKEITLGQPVIVKPRVADNNKQVIEQQSDINPQDKFQHPEVGKPIAVPQKPHLYIIKDKAMTDNTYTMRCPDCGHLETETMQKAETSHKWYCPKCNTLVAFNIMNKTDSPNKPNIPNVQEKKYKPKSQAQQEVKSDHTHKVNIGHKDTSLAELVWGRIFNKKHLKLPIGTNIVIGRKDTEAPSNLQIDDDYMSRRSVRLEAEAMANGTRYKFTVMKTSNPVYINSKEMAQGSSVYLNYGDTITMGKTTMILKKIK